MNYQEALKQLENNKELLGTHVINSAPKPHLVLLTFVSPSGHSPSFDWAIFEALYDRKKDNKEHLVELEQLDKPLTPMVAIKMNGINSLMTLDNYLAFRKTQNEE